MSGGEQKASFLGTISPWNVSRSTTPQPRSFPANKQDTPLQPPHKKDHAVIHTRRLSPRRYPKDCPPLKTRWFYAVDVPKSNPSFWGKDSNTTMPRGPPKKFVPFLAHDSQSIEDAFQELSDRDSAYRTTPPDNVEENEAHTMKVPVNEDHLFDVDIRRRELVPVYWLGPTYEVRRGSWFFSEGSTLRPCDENLATQLEEGYLKTMPWHVQSGQQANSDQSNDAHQDGLDPLKGSSRNVKPHTESDTLDFGSQTRNYRLFGAYMNNTVSYQDSTTAWLMSDDFMSRMSSTVYQRFGGAAGTKVVRGFSETTKPKDSSGGKNAQEMPRDRSLSGVEKNDGYIHTKYKRRSAPPDTITSAATLSDSLQDPDVAHTERLRSPLQRQMSSLTGEPQAAADIEEEARKQEEKEMEDSREASCEGGNRDIDHLVLVTHGIGQRLGLRLDSINFVHDINVLRKTLKNVYSASPDLQAINSDILKESKNCRIQVLPVCWRHLLDFPKQGLRNSRKELDIADPDNEEASYPSLADITLEGVPAVRNLIGDLAMDVLLYQSTYREHIAGIVQKECNRIYKLFKSRNPGFHGSVSLCGHSLGSAILFDILCRQPPEKPDQKFSTGRKGTSTPTGSHGSHGYYPLDFDCINLFCLGSPIALFQMLEGKTIVAQNVNSSQIPPDQVAHVSSPKCGQLFNIFHPSDPISYRIEPLISPAMSSLKPQQLPVVKRTIWTASGQGLTNIGARVGQSVGSLFSNFATGVASNLLNRSLGLNDGSASQASPADSMQQQHKHDDRALASTGYEAGRGQGKTNDDIRSQKAPTLIDPHLETLYDGFQKTRKDKQDADASSENSPSSERARKLRAEEAKVRALNSNGRVDYSIQEGAFDISLIASIASHLSYWADEDVSHFIMSQMLSEMAGRQGGKS